MIVMTRLLFLSMHSLKSYDIITLLLLCVGISRVVTFLRDADGATTHADSKSIHTGINQILGLGGCNHCRQGRRVREVWRRVETPAFADTLIPLVCITCFVSSTSFNKLTISSCHLQIWMFLFNIIYHVDLIH